MSSRLATGAESQYVMPVIWPSLQRQVEPGVVEETSADIQALQSALAEAEAVAQGFEEQVRTMQSEAAAQAEASFSKGLAEGRAAAMREMEAEHKAMLTRMTEALAEIAGLRAGMRREAESDMVRLALGIARRVLKRQVSIDRDALEGAVTSALEKLRSAELLKVQLHPRHADAVREQLEQLGVTSAVVEPLARLRPGTLLLESTRGGMDASIETQLQEIENVFSARLT